MTVPQHYEIECKAGVACPMYDDQTGNAWWDHVTGEPAEAPSTFGLAGAIIYHLSKCQGPIEVKEVYP
jgi:hypothetical protein